MIEIQEVTGEAEFQSLEHQWTSLLRNSKSDTLFLSWDWLYTWWKHFNKNNVLFLLLAWEKNVLKGIAPLFLVRGALFKEIHFLGSKGVGSDYLDFILYKEQEPEILLSILAYLKDKKNLWDVMNLSGIPDTSPSSLTLIHQQIVICKRLPYTVCPYLQLPKNKKVNECISKNMREHIKRKMKIFEIKYNGTFCQLHRRQDVEKGIEILFRLNENRCSKKQIRSPFHNPLFNAFHRDIIQKLFDKGIVRLGFMKIDESYVAAIYGYKYADKYMYYQSGFDEKWESLSPGTLMLYYSMKTALEEEASEFDFLRGDEEYKYRWTKQERRNVFFALFNRSIKSRFAKLLKDFESTARTKYSKFKLNYAGR